MKKIFITDKQGNKVLPKTHVSAVYDDNGNDIGSVMGAFEDEVRGLVDTPHQEYVTVATYASLPASGSKDTIYRVSNYDGSQSQVAADVYSEYAWDGTQYVFLCVKSAVGEVFDITVYNNNTKYADLSAALGVDGANIPSSLRRGGMSVKFVLSSDNKYVQYLYHGTSTAVADFANVGNWEKINLEEEVSQLGQYVDNPEWVRVVTDNNDKILYGVKSDGKFYFGDGCPPQVQEYVQNIIDGLSLDEYEDIVTFLGDLIDGDTLATLLNAKLDKEGLDADALATVQAIENPEWINVTTDLDGRILEGINSEGEKEIHVPLKKLNLTQDGMTALVNELEEQGISGGGISQEEADERYAVKSIEGEVSQNTQDIEALKASIDVNPPVVVALRNELDGVEARVDAIEQAGGLTPPTLNLYKKISSELIITQAELNSWEDHVVEVIADLKLTGSSNFALPTNAIIFMNGGRFVSGSYTGTLALNGAFIKAEPYQIIPRGIALSGYLKADIAYAEWFGAKGDGENYDAACFQDTNDRVKCNELHLVGGRTYLFERTLYCRYVLIRGCKNAKIIRRPQSLNISVITDLTSGIQPDSNGNVTISIDTTASDYSKLHVGDEVNIVNSGQWNFDGITFGGYIVQSIDNESVTLKGIESSSIRPLIGSSFSIINVYPLLEVTTQGNIQNLHIDGGYTAFRTLVENGKISWRTGATMSTQSLQGYKDSSSQDVVIENCLIENSLADAIFFGGNYGKVCHNSIIHAGANGIHFSGCKGVVLRDNYIFDTNINQETGHNEGAITYSNFCYDILIDGNYFDNCLTGIGSIDSADNCKSIITNNIFSNFRTHGIHLVIAETQYGDRFREYIISNNRFIATHDLIEGSGEQEDRIAPYVQRVECASGNGICCHTYTNATLENFIVSNNIFKDCGVMIRSAEDAIISNNVFCIKHTYSTSAERPNYMIGSEDAVVNVQGNTIRNHTDNSIANIINAKDSTVVIGSNVYSKLENCSFVFNNNSDITQYNNIELS